MKKQSYNSFYASLSLKNNTENKDVPVTEDKKPKYIKITTAPLSKDSIVRSQPIAEFEKSEAKRRGLHKFVWTDVNFINSHVLTEFNKIAEEHPKVKPQDLTKIDLEFLTIKKKPLALILIDMGPYGFALITNEAIDINQPICSYAGYVIPQNLYQITRGSKYKVEFLSRHPLFLPVITTEDQNQVFYSPWPGKNPSPALIDAERYCNFGGFAPHLPKQEDLPPEMQQCGIATANMIGREAYYLGYSHFVFYSTRKIQKGELLGFDYGSNFWGKQNQNPALFTKFGEFTIYEMNPSNKKVSESKIDTLSFWNSSKTAKKSLFGYHNCKDLVTFKLLDRQTRQTITGLQETLKKEIRNKK